MENPIDSLINALEEDLGAEEAKILVGNLLMHVGPDDFVGIGLAWAYTYDRTGDLPDIKDFLTFLHDAEALMPDTPEEEE